MRGTLYGIGTGPGDPELLTLAAIRTLKACDVIAVPAASPGEHTAFAIVEEYIEGKLLLECVFSMNQDPKVRKVYRGMVVEEICSLLDEGKNVGFITLGDPTIYSTYMYVHQVVDQRGYSTRIISGIPSFIAAAAALNISLCEGNEALHIIPGQGENLKELQEYGGTRVIMKAGRNMDQVLQSMKGTGNVSVVTRVTMEGETIHPEWEPYWQSLKSTEKPDYFSIVIAKEEKS